jgi:glycosyltransferase involved in cell wall biosynthesis
MHKNKTSKKILFVVHRYYPYPGGSEYYVKNMAEETFKRGHEVWVYADENMGDQNGVKVTSNFNIIFDNFDLIIIHGDCTTQNKVIANIKGIRSPVLYMLIKPGTNNFIMRGMSDAKFVSYSTTFDKEFIEKNGYSEKMICVPHGIPFSSIGKLGFKEKYGIKGKMVLSCGGFWPHKGHLELAEIFNQLNLDSTLVITGYMIPFNDSRFRPKDTKKVKTLLINDPLEIFSAMKEADLYVMNSYEEGFGLVLLEAMMNKTTWASRRVGGADQLKNYGYVYDTHDELSEILLNYKQSSVEKAYNFVINNHTIENTVNKILEVV